MRTAVARVAACVLTAVLIGCGGGGDDDGDGGAKGPPPPNSREQKDSYVARADRSCQRFQREAAGRVAETAQGTARQARDARLRAAQTLDELRRLNPPPADRATLDRYFAIIEQQVRVELPRLERAARRGRRDEARKVFVQIRTRGQEARKLAQQYGFRVCGRS